MQTTSKRPEYLALDNEGIEYSREARIIGELPLSLRHQALEEATERICELVGMQASGRIAFGSPVFCAFNSLNRNRAKAHSQSKLLLTFGDDIPLDLCATYA